MRRIVAERLPIPEGTKGLILMDGAGFGSSFGLVIEPFIADVVYWGSHSGKVKHQDAEIPTTVLCHRPFAMLAEPLAGEDVDPKTLEWRLFVAMPDGTLAPWAGGNVWRHHAAICQGGSNPMPKTPKACFTQFFGSSFNSDLVQFPENIISMATYRAQWNRENGYRVPYPRLVGPLPTSEDAWEARGMGYPKEVIAWGEKAHLAGVRIDDLKRRQRAIQMTMDMRGNMEEPGFSYATHVKQRARLQRMNHLARKLSVVAEDCRMQLKEAEDLIGVWGITWAKFYSWWFRSAYYRNRSRGGLFERFSMEEYGYGVDANVIIRKMRLGYKRASKQMKRYLHRERLLARLEYALQCPSRSNDYNAWSQKKKDEFINDWWETGGWQKALERRSLDSIFPGELRQVELGAHAVLCLSDVQQSDFNPARNKDHYCMTLDKEYDGLVEQLTAWLEYGACTEQLAEVPEYCENCDQDQYDDGPIYEQYTPRSQHDIERGMWSFFCRNCEHEISTGASRHVTNTVRFLPLWDVPHGTLAKAGDDFFLRNNNGIWGQIRETVI